MSVDVTTTRTTGSGGASRTTTNLLSKVLLALLVILLIEVMFEAWVQVLLASRHFTFAGELIAELPSWPKNLKNGLLIALVVVAVSQITLERRWREFRTGADLALLTVGVIMVLAGLFGESPPLLIGEALFVYFRGAIVFYAWRALNPPWRQVRSVLWILGTIVGVNVIIAIVQMFVGYPAYARLRWIDLTWSGINRAHALFDHPNHLGHVIGLTLIGMLAWMVGKPRAGRRWWVLLALVGLGLSATQSRESIIGVVAAGLVIWFLRRGAGVRVFLALAIVVTLFGLHLVIRPDNIAEFANRLRGVTSAFEVPSGTEQQHLDQKAQVCDGGGAGCAPAETTVPPREIRVLFFQQGITLTLKRPILGYGVGQFGGIVAYRNDPLWPLDPRFGPGGFNTYNFSSITVDSFWLHLVVETGILGGLAYLVWLVMLLLPLLRATPRFARGDRSTRGPTQDQSTQAPTVQPHPAILWAIGSLIFGVLVACLSPALEDPLFPALLFSVIAFGWIVNRRVTHPGQSVGTTDEPVSPSGLSQLPNRRHQSSSE